MIQKNMLQMYPLQSANTRHGVIHFTVDGMVRDSKH